MPFPCFASRFAIIGNGHTTIPTMPPKFRVLYCRHPCRPPPLPSPRVSRPRSLLVIVLTWRTHTCCDDERAAGWPRPSKKCTHASFYAQKSTTPKNWSLIMIAMISFCGAQSLFFYLARGLEAPRYRNQSECKSGGVYFILFFFFFDHRTYAVRMGIAMWYGKCGGFVVCCTVTFWQTRLVRVCQRYEKKKWSVVPV